jgi:hypothetical protein
LVDKLSSQDNLLIVLIFLIKANQFISQKILVDLNGGIWRVSILYEIFPVKIDSS